ncbi:MAG: type II toxin-antitoxin system VapC family toxin [Methanosarcinales archaeon]
MHLIYLPYGYSAFIDSNIFIYHLLRHRIYRDVVEEFFLRVELGLYKGFINDVVVSEVFYIYIRANVCDLYNITPRDFPTFIKSNPSVLSQIDTNIVKSLLSMPNITLLSGIPIDSIKDIIDNYHLLPSDAIHATTCKIYGINNIATNDSDFERVDFLEVWKP